MALRLFLIAFVVSLGLTALLIRWAPLLRLVDQPGERKVHIRPTPRGGGLAIFLGFLVALLDVWTTVFNLATAPHSLLQLEMLRFVGLGFLVVLLGLLDDWFNLPWPIRLTAQAALAAAVVIWVASSPFHRTQYSILSTQYPVIAGVFATIWIVALINAFNMLDNMDGLSAGVAWIAAATFAALVWSAGSKASYAHLSHLMLMGTLAGFLCFNRPPARIFMGDAGSTFLGFFFGVYSLTDRVTKPDVPQTWLVPVCILAVPLYDQTTVVALRLWQRRSPFYADKQHLSHRLAALGLSQPMAVGVIYVLALVSGGAGWALMKGSSELAWWIGGGLVGLWALVAAVEYVPHFRK